MCTLPQPWARWCVHAKGREALGPPLLAKGGGTETVHVHSTLAPRQGPFPSLGQQVGKENFLLLFSSGGATGASFKSWAVGVAPSVKIRAL